MTETGVMRACPKSSKETLQHGSQCLLVGLSSIEVALVVSTTALDSLLSVVSTTTLNDRSPIVSAPALSVVSATAFLGSSACWGIVAASSHCHLEHDCWEKIQKKLNDGRD